MHQTVYTDNINKAKIYREYVDVLDDYRGTDSEDVKKNCGLMSVN